MGIKRDVIDLGFRMFGATGLHRLGGIVKHLQAHRRKVYLVDIDPRVREELTGQDWLRDGMIQPSLAEAIKMADLS